MFEHLATFDKIMDDLEPFIQEMEERQRTEQRKAEAREVLQGLEGHVAMIDEWVATKEPAKGESGITTPRHH